MQSKKCCRHRKQPHFTTQPLRSYSSPPPQSQPQPTTQCPINKSRRPRTHKHNHNHIHPNIHPHSLPNSTRSSWEYANSTRHFHHTFNNCYCARETSPRAAPGSPTRLAAHSRHLLAFMAGDGLGCDHRAFPRFVPGKSRLAGSGD